MAGIFACERARAEESKYKVKVEVEMKDEALVNRVQSLISRELRKLGDVEVADSDTVFGLHVPGFATETRSGAQTGHSIVGTVTMPFAVSEDKTERFWQTLFGATPDQYLGLRLYAGGTDDLEDTCKQIVADFDAQEKAWARRFVSAAAEAIVKKCKGQNQR